MISQETKQTANINGHLDFQCVSGKVRLTYIKSNLGFPSQSLKWN